MLYKFIKKIFAQRFFRFAVSGGIATLVDIVLLYCFTEFLGIWYIYSSIFSFLIGSFTHFLISRAWVFEKTSKTFLQSYLSFTSVHLVALVVSTLFLYLLTEIIGIYYIFSKVLTVGVSVIITFIGNKRTTFKQ